MSEPTNLDKVADLKPLLAVMYNPSRRWSYEEECLLLQIVREPNYMEEAKAILEYWQAIPQHSKQFFPHSMRMMLTDWTGLLDKAHVFKQARAAGPQVKVADKIQYQFELKRVEKRMKTITDSYSENTDWAAEDRAEFRKLRERKQELVKALGMVI